MADEIALRFPQRAFHQAENWVERAGDLNPTLTIIHLKGGGFKPLFFVNGGSIALYII
jgi:hypothetical protein